VKVTHLMFNFMEMVAARKSVHQPEGPVTDFRVGLHAQEPADHRRIDGAEGVPPPTIMQQSIGWLGDDGRGIRYQYLYLNEPDHAVPPPPLRGQAAPQPGSAPDRIDPGAR